LPRISVTEAEALFYSNRRAPRLHQRLLCAYQLIRSKMPYHHSIQLRSSLSIVMTSQPSIEHKSNSPRRVNTQRAANWFRNPSIPQFKLKSSSPRSSPYLDAPLSVQSSSSTLQSTPSRATSTYNNSRRVRNSPVIVPIMPAVRSFSFTDLSSRAELYFVFSFGSSSSINLDGPVALIYFYANYVFALYTLQQPPHLSFLHLYIRYSINHS
jgi:hypothetical protein